MNKLTRSAAALLAAVLLICTFCAAGQPARAAASASDMTAASASDTLAPIDPSGTTAEVTEVVGGGEALSTAITVDLIRLGGSDRIDTALKIAENGWSRSGAKYVFLANALSFPDALAGVPLAGMLDAPILLTTGKSLETNILEKIKNIAPSRVYLLGGDAAISTACEKALRDAGLSVTRLSGSDRFGTAVRIAQEMDSLRAGTGNGGGEVNFLASALNFADALSAGSPAALLRSPVLYCMPDGKLDSVTAAYLREKSSRSPIVLGGTAAISGDVSASLAALGLPAPERISGSDRFATSMAVCSRFSDLFLGGDVLLASGLVFPDALAGGSLAAKFCAPVLMTGGNAILPASLHGFVAGLAPQRLFVLGGQGAISDYAVSCLLSGTTMTTTTVKTTKKTTAKTTAKTTKATTAPQPNAKVAYLTFDDGPSANTKKILDVLDKYKIKATFFVIYHSGQESLYKEIVKRGHALGLHSYTHEYSTIYKSETAFWNDQTKLADYLEKTTGVRPKILRFPGGASNTVSRSYCKGIMTALTASAGKKGFSYFDWNVDSGDADANCVSASKIVSRVKSGLGSQKKPVILMHDTAAKTTTPEALPEVITYLKDKGYSFGKLDDSGAPVCHHAVSN